MKNILEMHTLAFLLLSFLETLVSSDQDFSVRLVGASPPVEYEGFVEIFKEGSWRKITNTKWDYRNDIVVCRQLGFADVGNKPTKIPQYSSEASFDRQHYFCQGAERKISHCDVVDMNYRKVHIHCKDGNEVWVSCLDTKDYSYITPKPSKSSGKISYIEVRLKGTGIDQEKATPQGVLEIKIGKEWHHVCAEGWTKENSHVACGHLGYSYAMDVVPQMSYEMPKYHLMRDVACSGAELNLLSCEHAGFGKHRGCRKSVLLHCGTNVFEQKTNIRLRGGQRNFEGRVEVFRDGAWSTVCHDGWDLNDANVVCKQLGFGTAKKAARWAEYGQGAVLISMSNVDCKGTESNLLSCKIQNPSQSCSHFKDAGVVCNSPQPQFHKVRLVGGNTRYEGRVEVYRDGVWYSVCGVQFSEYDGEVVCRELGLGFLGKVFSTWKYGIGTIGIYEPRCSGNEQSLLDCNNRPWFRGICRYYDMASVKCTNYAPDISIDIAAMRSSIKINKWNLRQLSCSKSENCLASSAYAYDAYRNPKSFNRKLMVFTSLIQNLGTAAFRPNRHKNEWEWHQCHQHYHSMEYFARYDVIDFHGRKVAEGHKASFCLEDSKCHSGLKKMYNCTDKGDQGISVGCADNYSNAIDCQWVDVTDIDEGNYTLMVHLNPTRLIAESDYENNVASCEVRYYNEEVDVGHCSADPCKQRSYGGTGYGMCCHFPFIHNGKSYNGCISSGKDSPWCSTTYNYDKDNRWGYCSPQEY